MYVLIPTTALALFTLTCCAAPDAPKKDDPEDLLFPLPPREVAKGMFEKWQREAAKKPSNVTYTRVEYDKKVFWVVEGPKLSSSVSTFIRAARRVRASSISSPPSREGP